MGRRAVRLGSSSGMRCIIKRDGAAQVHLAEWLADAGRFRRARDAPGATWRADATDRPVVERTGISRPVVSVSAARTRALRTGAGGRGVCLARARGPSARTDATRAAEGCA